MKIMFQPVFLCSVNNHLEHLFLKHYFVTISKRKYNKPHILALNEWGTGKKQQMKLQFCL